MSLSAAVPGLPKVTLALYAPHLEAVIASQNPDDELVQPTSLERERLDPSAMVMADSPWRALHMARAAGARSVLLVSADQALPQGLLHRMLLAAESRSNGVISPLGLDQLAVHAPLRGVLDAGQEVVDRWAWALGERATLAGHGFNPAASLWCEDALLALPQATDTLDVPLGIDSLWTACAAISDGDVDQGTAPSNAAAAQLAGSLLDLGVTPDQPPPARFGLDGRKVLLHVLHGWGGGSERFVRDLMAAGIDQQTHHLVLRAEADPKANLTAQALCLHHDLDQPPLRRWVLSEPISVTALHSAEVQDLLHSVCTEFAVGAVLVSSVIGHSLDVLRTGLPTHVVCHDYFPLWPALHADFGSSDFDGSDEALQTLLSNGAVAPFREQSLDYWRQLRTQYLNALKQSEAALFAPTVSVRRNVCRLAAELTGGRWIVQAHGLAPWKAAVADNQPPERDTLRVLVPGRINGGKGEDLLAQVLSEPLAGIEWVLLGCGHAGMRFFGHDHVHVVLNYAHDDLPAQVAAFKPDLVFLPATVAETFGYSLSEMWSLRLPVLATRIGSYAERIRDGIDGFLIEPDAQQARTALLRLRTRRDLLQRLRTNAPQPESTGVVHARYLTAFPSTQTVEARQSERATPRVLQSQQETRLRRALQSQLRALQAQIETQHIDLEKRAAWGFGLDRELRETQQAALQERQRNEASLQAADAERGVLSRALQAAELELADAHRVLQEEANGALHSAAAEQALGQQIRQRLLDLHAERAHFEQTRNAILQSSSWRLTRPLRGMRRVIGGLFSRLRFRQQRLLSVLHRSLRSLKSRGIKGTLQRARQEFSPAQPSIELHIPAAAPFAPFELPCPEQPKVSVIIPAYNHLDHTLTCLRSIAAQPSHVQAEIIVVDDCSSDETQATLPQITGLRYLRNVENLGFIGACNAGAEAARGEYLVFLNNDTAVQPGWLDALINTFSTHADVGLVGAKLIYPDGRLQEAGGIVFADASGWNYGRFGDPSAPEYNFVREADYCSGAAIAVPTALFNEFGGFDRHYAPAYYEDTDLAMKVWTKGLRVLYQPAASVVHFEGISSGTDTTTGVKAYQVVNQQKFLERWRERLQQHPPAGTRIETARQHRDTRHVLIIDATTPTPDQDSGSLRMVNLMKVLRAEGCAIRFFADNRAWLPRYTADLQQLGVEVLWHPFLSDPVRWFAEQGSLLDAVILSRHYIASQYVDLVRQHAPEARLAFDTVDLHYLREQREAELAQREDLHRQAAVTREKELELMRRCDVTLVVSPVEQSLLANEVPEAQVEVLSNVHEVFGRRAEFAERADLMFVGGYQHPPNVDAVQWFADDILPLIRAQDPTIRFHIIGSKAPENIAKLAERDGIVFHGFVEDIEPLLDGIRIAVAPLRWGAGVKGKVNMSMSYGQPVVATPIAVEGMYAEPERDVLVADNAADFAAAVLRLYHDEALWQQLSDNGLRNVQTHFSFDAARAALRRVLSH